MHLHENNWFPRMSLFFQTYTILISFKDFFKQNANEFRNQPEITFADCNCCIPINPCKLSVVDNVQTVYFDNPTMDKLENKTRCCNDTRTWCCGGQGQRLRLANEFCGMSV